MKESPLPANRVFFSNLDGLRFVCFFLVFLFHIAKTVTDDYLQQGLELPYFLKAFGFLFKNGNLGVNFFFVLSGFLITFLLIKEKDYAGQVNVGKFYVRRILRIWPLFYLCVFIGFVVFPMLANLLNQHNSENARPIYYLFFLNNFDVIEQGFPASLILGILWSVAVEEQFYLTWPLVIRFVPAKKLKYACFFIIGGSLLFRFIYRHEPNVLYFHSFAVIGDMAVGGLLAYYTSRESRLLHWIINLKKRTIFLVYGLAVAIFLVKHKVFIPGSLVVFERLVIAVFFAFIIAEQNFATRSFYKFTQFKLVSRLGIYTYGLYCLQFIGIYGAIILLAKIGLEKYSLAGNIGFFLVALILTLSVSLLSYHLFEKHFLKLKDKFAIITR